MRSNERVIAVGKKFHFRHLVPRSMLTFWDSTDWKCDRRLTKFQNILISHKCCFVTKVVLEHYFGNNRFFLYQWFLFWRNLLRCLAFLIPFEVLSLVCCCCLANGLPCCIVRKSSWCLVSLALHNQGKLLQCIF